MQQMAYKKVYPVITILLVAALLVAIYIIYYQQRVHKIELKEQQQSAIGIITN